MESAGRGLVKLFVGKIQKVLIAMGGGASQVDRFSLFKNTRSISHHEAGFPQR